MEKKYFLDKIQNNLSWYLNGDHFDASMIQEDWFPEINADIFISHSRLDEKLAMPLASWIESNTGLHCFIDSLVWG